MSTDKLIIASFVAGAIPWAVFVIYYGFRVRWNESLTGRVLLATAVTLVIGYIVSILTLTVPEFFQEHSGEWVRIIIRFTLAGFSWIAVVSLFRAQRRGERNTADEKEKV